MHQLQGASMNGDGKFFGENSAWIHNRCVTVPTPRRREIKDIQQNLYNFISEILKDNYKITVPKKHSEFLEKIK